MQALVIALAATASALAPARRAAPLKTPTKAAAVADAPTAVPDRVSKENPLRVVIAGAGFGGPIQLASNAMQLFREMDDDIYDQIEHKFTWTGNLTNGIKDGIRDEWYAKFDLASPAAARSMPYTGVIERPDLQEILLGGLTDGVVANGVGVAGYEKTAAGGVNVAMEDGRVIEAHVLVGADGIWSNVRAAMRDEPARGEGSGVSYSGYTVFAGELNYASPDNGEVGYKVYI